MVSLSKEVVVGGWEREEGKITNRQKGPKRRELKQVLKSHRQALDKLQIPLSLPSRIPKPTWRFCQYWGSRELSESRIVTFVWVPWAYSLCDPFFPFLLHSPSPIILDLYCRQGGAHLCSLLFLSSSVTYCLLWLANRRHWHEIVEEMGNGEKPEATAPSTLNGFSGNWRVSSLALAPAGQGCHGFSYF